MKKLLQKAGILALVLSLTGCFKMRMNVDVKSDATYTGSYTVLMKESMLTIGGGTSDEALEQMAEQFKKDDPEAEVEIVKEGEGEDAFAGVKVSKLPADSVKVTKNDNVITLEMDLSDMQNTITEDPEVSSMGLSIASLKEYGAEAVITVNMPGKPEANTGTVEGNRVTVDLLEANEKTLTVTCKAGLPKAAKIGLGIAGALAVVLVVLLALKKKK
ncbi:MAG: hypothetical protein K6G61_09365 [Solobacterium sp.]|nr:hypothetical protein [Solobacterium sp.]